MTTRRTTPLPTGWAAIRERVLQRDHRTCSWCGSQQRLEVDHINRNDDHSLGNLRTLCHNCHLTRTARQAGREAAYIASLRKRKPEVSPFDNL